jgi:hypothetical protein
VLAECLKVPQYCQKEKKKKELSQLDWARTHACNPSYSGGGDQEGQVPGQPWQKLLETSSQPMTGCGSEHLSSQLPGEAQIGSRSKPAQA